jgi:Trichohyalin-plectin-homology domain
VKKANRIILATKCSIIRDAQIAEKNEIAREFHNENLRLEKIMLVERDKALVEEELKREQERKNLLKYSHEIRKQLEERELIRAKEVERIEEEAIAMRKALDTMEKVRRMRIICLNLADCLSNNKLPRLSLAGGAKQDENTQREDTENSRGLTEVESLESILQELGVRGR